MAKRLEDQLTEARALLAQREQELAAAQQAHAKAVAAAEAKKEAAEKECSAASEACDALHEKIETEHKVMIYTRKPDGDGGFDINTRWHPDFLKRVAALVGVHYDDRETVDPQNQRDSLYGQALCKLRDRLIDNLPEVLKAQKHYNAAAKAASEARSTLWDARRPVSQAEEGVRRAKATINEIEGKIEDRKLEKAHAPSPQAAAAQEKLEAAARAARAKLRDIIEGKLTIKLEKP